MARRLSQADRVRVMRAREAWGADLKALLRLVKDVGLLLKDCVVDPRVPRQEKLIAVGAGAYLLSPIDLVPDWIPVLGQTDDLAVLVWAFRRLVRAAGYDVLRELWRGTDEGLALILTIARVED